MRCRSASASAAVCTQRISPPQRSPTSDLQALGKAVPHLHRTPIEIVIGIGLLAEGVEPGKRMARRPSAWPVPFEHRDSDLTACEMIGNGRPNDAGADDHDA